MYLLKKFLNTPGYKFIGRGGVLYFDGRKEYLVGSENYVRNKLSKEGYEVIIFSKYIQSKKIKNILTDSEKNKIAFGLKLLLDRKKIITTIE